MRIMSGTASPSVFFSFWLYSFARKGLLDLSKAIHYLKKCFIDYHTTHINHRKVNLRERSLLFRNRLNITIFIPASL